MVRDNDAEIRAAKYRVGILLSMVQKGCPVCGASVKTQGDLHHVFIRRDPDAPELYSKYNMLRVCNTCHVPESPKLGYLCAMTILKQYGPGAVESWCGSLPFRVKTLPDFYWWAKEDFLNATEDPGSPD